MSKMPSPSRARLCAQNPLYSYTDTALSVEMDQTPAPQPAGNSKPRSPQTVLARRVWNGPTRAGNQVRLQWVVPSPEVDLDSLEIFADEGTVRILR